MAGDSIGTSPSAGPEQIANELLRNVGAMNEAAREARLSAKANDRPPNTGYNNDVIGGEHAPSLPSSGYQQTPWHNPIPFEEPSSDAPNNYYQGLNDAASNFALETELRTQLDGFHGTSSRHRLASAADLADVVARVNADGLAGGLKLAPIDDAAKLHITDLRDHANLTVDLETGKITDQSGNEYVAKDQIGPVDFKPKEPVTIKTSDNFSVTYDAKDQLTKIALPDGTILAKTNPQTFFISDATTKPTGTAQNLRYDGHTLTYKSQDDSGQSLVIMRGDKTVKEDLATGQIYEKRTSDSGKFVPALEIDQLILDRALLAEAARLQGVDLPLPPLRIPRRHNPQDDPI